MLALALVWWAWSAFVWAANAQDADAPVMRLCLLLATAFIFITGLSLPRAFESGGTLFACTYAAVRFLHLWLYADASRRGNASWEAIAGFAVTVVLGMVLLIVGSFIGGGLRVLFWSAAVAIDYAGPAWLTRERLRGLQQVAVAHFAERYSLFVIICLGESIVTIGVNASHAPRLSATLVAVVSLGLLITIGMWWTYFDRFAATAESRLRHHDDAVLAAADGYSYLHLVIVAGIIIFAVGAKLVIDHADNEMSEAGRLALCGGVALYLLGHVAFRLRMVGVLGYRKLAVVGALMALFALGGGLPAWSLAAAITVLLAGLCALETVADGRPLRAGGAH
jgi:low temperature requirement protein LtrA